MTSTTMKPDDHYTIISADSHAGGSHADVPRVPRPEVPRRLRRLARQVQEPVHGPAATTGRLRNWDDELRNGDAGAPTASSARSSSRTPCRRSSRASCCSPRPPKPDEYEHRLAGIRAHNRWLADFCGEFPERRAGIGQIFLNDVDDAIDDVQWIKEHGLRGGVLISDDPARRRLGRSRSTTPYYDPLWAVCEDLERPGQLPRRHRLPRLRQVPGRRAALHHRGRRSTRSARSCSCCSRACSSASRS